MKKLIAGIVMLPVVLSLAGCSAKSEKQRFIDATTEATCLVFKSDNIFDPALEKEAKEIYTKFGFDAEDDTKMEEVTKKYENDPEVQSALLDAVSKCGGDNLKGLTESMEQEAPAEETEAVESMDADNSEVEAEATVEVETEVNEEAPTESAQ